MTIDKEGRLKLMLEVKVFGTRSVKFKIIFIDKEINDNNSNILYENYKRFKITKGNKINYTIANFTIPTDILKDNFKDSFAYSYRCESNRKYMLKELSEEIMFFIRASYRNHSNYRIKFKGDCWFFY